MIAFFLVLIAFFFCLFACSLLWGNRIIEGIEARSGKEADEMLRIIEEKMKK
ncbi:hypothetical protein [Alkalihalobacillus sp. 1P02AB]|uniref:hypothetical protein n=1 Tax=Alkalihalobacillus sp. 1P02AB TaxID=3132260 RepID=UPI0039A483AE